MAVDLGLVAGVLHDAGPELASAVEAECLCAGEGDDLGFAGLVVLNRHICSDVAVTAGVEILGNHALDAPTGIHLRDVFLGSFGGFRGAGTSSKGDARDDGERNTGEK